MKRKRWMLAQAGVVTVFASLNKLTEHVQKNAVTGKVYHGDQLYCYCTNGVLS